MAVFSSAFANPRKNRMAKFATLLVDGPLLEAFHIHYTPVSNSAFNTASSAFVLLLTASPSIFFRMDYQIIVISEMHHDASANAAKGSSI